MCVESGLSFMKKVHRLWLRRLGVPSPALAHAEELRGCACVLMAPRCNGSIFIQKMGLSEVLCHFNSCLGAQDKALGMGEKTERPGSCCVSVCLLQGTMVVVRVCR